MICIHFHEGTAGYDHLDMFLNGLMNSSGICQRRPGTGNRKWYTYQKTPARIILEIIKLLALKPQDVFVRLGSGLGQVVILMNLLTGVMAKGVEFEPAFCEYATNCAAELQIKDVEFHQYRCPLCRLFFGYVFFMYTPFEGKMLQDVRIYREEKIGK